MRLSSFFLLVLLAFLTSSGVLFWHFSSSYEEGSLRTTKLLEEVSRFVKMSAKEDDSSVSKENLFLKVLEEEKLGTEKLEELSLEAREYIILRQQNNKIEAMSVEKIEKLIEEISIGLRPKLEVEKNETVDFIKLKIPEHLKSGFEDVFDVQTVKSSDLSLYVISDKILNDLSQLLSITKNEYGVSEVRLEYLFTINKYRFSRIQKLEIRHFLKLKANRLAKNFNSIRGEVETVLRQRKSQDELKSKILDQLERERSEAQRATFENISTSAEVFQDRFQALGEDLKQQFVFGVLTFVILLFLILFVFYKMLSSPIRDLIAPENAKNTGPFIKEIRELLQKMQRQQENNLVLQTELVKKEKLAIMGGVVNMLAHEFKNPLAIIQLAVDDLKEEKGLMSSEDLKKISEMVQRMNQQIQNLNRFAEIDFQMQEVDVSETIQEIFIIFDSALRKSQVYYKINTPSNLKILTVKSYLEIILINLISNSIRALEKTKEPSIKIEMTEFPEKVEIRVSDNGAGITEEKLQHIFDAYYTTKNSGQGAGLGLHIVQNLIIQLNGEILVESKVDEGTTFKIYLPKSLLQD